MFYKIDGYFTCQKCGAEAEYARVYPATLNVTWLCPNRHMSEVHIGIERGY